MFILVKLLAKYVIIIYACRNMESSESESKPFQSRSSLLQIEIGVPN